MFVKEKTQVGFSQELNYAHLIDDGVIIMKDGAFLTTFLFRGPDVNSSSGEELDSLAQNFNRSMLNLEDGWMIHVDELRVPSIDYPAEGFFPDAVSAMIDAERRQYYKAEGSHFENMQFLTFVWKFPKPIIKSLKPLFIKGLPNSGRETLTSLYKTFNDTVERCINVLSIDLHLEQLNSEDLLSYISTCIYGDLTPVAVPHEGTYLDLVLSKKPITGGFLPKAGENHIRIISFTDYLNDEMVPGLLEELGAYPCIYRWSNRFIPLSSNTADKEIEKIEKNWNNKAKGLLGIIKSAILGTEVKDADDDAARMSVQAGNAKQENKSQDVRFGYWTSELVFHNESYEAMNGPIKAVKRYLEQRGFTCFEEVVNTFDAYMGTIPGHGTCNARRLWTTSVNLGQVLPLHTIWAGSEFSSKDSKLPEKSPPAIYAATTGNTPFRIHMDYQDVGHQIIAGPTGSGKTTYLQLLMAQFLRYENARIYIFDQDYSHKGFTAALDGYHYDIGAADNICFNPFYDLADEKKIQAAVKFVEMLSELQSVKLNSDIRYAISNAVNLLATDKNYNNRNMTILRSLIQNTEVKQALRYYTVDGSIKMLDAKKSNIDVGHLQNFETKWLLSQSPEVFVPILKHIFDHIELKAQESEGRYPTLIILEEAWRYILNEMFARNIQSWLLTLRKFNIRIIFTTPTLTALYEPETQKLNRTSQILFESCPIRIFLPNQQMDTDTRLIYERMNLSERQVEILNKEAIPKQHYYFVSPEGKRLFELGLNETPLARAFIGLSQEKSAQLFECKKQYQSQWLDVWLEKHNLQQWKKSFTNYKQIGDAA